MPMLSTPGTTVSGWQQYSLLVGLMLLLVVGSSLILVNVGSTYASAMNGCSEGLEVSEDVLLGTDCDDVILVPKDVKEVDGGDGDDRIIAVPGVEKINGGAGNDVIVGSSTVEEIDGGAGNDIIFGESIPPWVEVSKLFGVQAVSYLDGDNNDNTIYGGNGDQRIYAKDGNDIVFGERGNDKIFGGNGNDRLYGGVGDDLVSGQDQDDLISGGNGNDNVLGGYGNDLIRGDTVRDNRHTVPDDSVPDPMFPDGLRGGAGVDTISFATAVTPGFRNADVPTNPSSTYTDFPGESGPRGVYVDLAALVASNGRARDGGGTDMIGSDFENVVGSPFSDFIVGNSSANVINGGGGADVVLGMGGNDILYGGGGSDHLDGGNGTDATWGGSSGGGSSNYCIGHEGGDTYNCWRSTTGVVPDDTSKLRAGLVETGWSGNGPDYTEAYFLGSTAADEVSTSFNLSTRTITFTSTGTTFDTTQIEEGCSYSNAKTANCQWVPNHPLDSVIYYGDDGNDDLSANGAGLPITTSVFSLGGNGSDQEIQGSDNTEDVLIDGPDAGNDILKGYGRTDSVYQGGGKDWIYGGADGDVMYSTGICEQNTISGGPGLDNNTWAALPTPERSMTQGVYASLVTEEAGNQGSGGAPSCIGGSVDSLVDLENLEGSGGRDTLYGDNGPNSMLGRAGADSIYGGGGNDNLHMFSGDYDAVINCGGGTDDTLRRDLQRTDLRDSTHSGCESVQNKEPEYVSSWDVSILGENPDPLVFHRLGERYGTTAQATVPKNTQINSAYVNGVTRGVTGSVPDTEDTAVSLDGANDYVTLGTGADPYSSFTEGYSFEIWVKFDSATAPSGEVEGIFSRYASDLSKGLLFFRTDSGLLLFGTKKNNGQFTFVLAPDPGNPGVWHQFVGTLSGSTITLYVDGTPYSSNWSPSSVFPDPATGVPMWLGNYPGGANYLSGDVDSFAAYEKPLSQCEVNRHFSIRTTTASAPAC